MPSIRTIYLKTYSIGPYYKIIQTSFPLNPLTLTKVIEDTNSLLKPNCLAKQIQYKFTNADKLFADVDDITMPTVFRNLITSALKYTSKDELIQVNIYNTEESVIFTNSVTETGMHQDTVNQLFLINSNIQYKGTANETGTGLGLVLCYEIIKNIISILD